MTNLVCEMHGRPGKYVCRNCQEVNCSDIDCYCFCIREQNLKPSLHVIEEMRNVEQRPNV